MHSPPVGGPSLRIPFPVVVLPQPLSPTRQKISPLPTSRSTPSTARTYSGLALRNAARNPRRFSNQTRKSRRTKYGSRATSRRLLRRRRGGQVARREVARAHRVEFRLLIDAQRPGVLASRMEAAADGRVDQGRQEARDVRRQGLRALDVRERPDQVFRVRVFRVLVDVPHAAALHDLPGVHDRHRVARLRHDAEVVGDQDHREIELALESLEEFEDLRLDHDVQRGHRFVRDHDPRIAREGHGDHDPLAHAAGELVRVLLGALAVDADEFKQLADALHRGFFVHLVVDDDRLRDLVPDPLHRIQGVHRPLEDDRDVLPPDPAELALRDLREVIPDVIDRPLDDLPVRREEAHDRQGRRRLAAAALPREPEALAFSQGEIDAVDRPDGPLLGLEMSLEALDRQERHVTAPRIGSDELGNPFFGAWFEDAGKRLNVFSDAHQARAHRIRGMGLSRFTKPVSSSDLRTRVRCFYVYQTASSFAIWIPFWALWIRGHLSSDFEFTLVDVAFWVGLLVFQLPVGVVADRTPRRRTIVLSELFRSAGILGYGISATFWGYVAANVVWSLGAAFSIGTSAYLYETLLEAGHETEFPRYIGRVTMIQLLSNAAGAFVGGVFVGVVGDLRLTLLVGAILNLGAIGGAVTVREPKVERTPQSTYVEQLLQGLRVVRRREGVALLIGVEVFLGVTLYVMAVFRPLYLQALGLSESAIAISISGFLLVAAIWSAFAGTITRVLGDLGTLALRVLRASAAFFGMYGAGEFPGAALPQVPLYIVWSLRPALTTAFLNRRLEPGQRATVLSMGAFAYTLGLVVVEPLAGALTTTTGLLNLGIFLGIVTFFPCAYILARWRTTVAAWPAVTPLPSRLIAGSRVSRFHRLLERMSRLRP